MIAILVVSSLLQANPNPAADWADLPSKPAATAANAEQPKIPEAAKNDYRRALELISRSDHTGATELLNRLGVADLVAGRGRSHAGQTGRGARHFRQYAASNTAAEIGGDIGCAWVMAPRVLRAGSARTATRTRAPFLRRPAGNFERRPVVSAAVTQILWGRVVSRRPCMKVENVVQV